MGFVQICHQRTYWLEVAYYYLGNEIIQKSLVSVGLKHPANSVFFFFLGPYPQHMEVARLGVELELQLPVYTTATEMPDLSWIVIYTTAHGIARSWTHWAGPGIEPESSWILVRFVTAELQQELQQIVFLCAQLCARPRAGLKALAGSLFWLDRGQSMHTLTGRWDCQNDRLVPMIIVIVIIFIKTIPI